MICKCGCDCTRELRLTDERTCRDCRDGFHD